MKPATINFPDDLTKGETLSGFSVEFAMDGEPMDIQSATVLLSKNNGVPIYEWETSIDGGKLICESAPSSKTKDWPTGQVAYRIELTLSDGTTIIPISGHINILP